jgi:hypothetical protein
MGEAAAKISCELLLWLPAHLVSLRGSALAAICFGFYYSQHRRKTALLTSSRVHAYSRITLLSNAARRWLRLLALTEEESNRFLDSLMQIYTILWEVKDKAKAKAKKAVANDGSSAGAVAEAEAEAETDQVESTV